MKVDERNKKQFKTKEQKFTSKKFSRPKRDYETKEFKYDERIAVMGRREDSIEY